MTLRVNSLTGFGSGGGPFSFALTDTDTTQNNTDTPSFASMTAGDPGGGRLLIAVITCSDNDSSADAAWWPATCTIGGVTATNHVSIDRDLSGVISIGVAVYSAIVPSGTTATVALTAAFSGTMDDWACALFRATRVNATPVDTDQDTGVGREYVELDTSAARFAVFGAVDSSNESTSWSGGGNTQTAVAHNKLIIGYDDAPLGGSTDQYTPNLDASAYAGAAFG